MAADLYERILFLERLSAKLDVGLANLAAAASAAQQGIREAWQEIGPEEEDEEGSPDRPVCPNGRAITFLFRDPCATAPFDVTIHWEGPAGEDEVRVFTSSPHLLGGQAVTDYQKDPTWGEWTVAATAPGHHDVRRVVFYDGKDCILGRSVALCPTTIIVEATASSECGSSGGVPGVDVDATITGRFVAPRPVPRFYKTAPSGLDDGMYSFCCTIFDGTGETDPGPSAAMVQSSGDLNALSLPDPPPGCAFRIYSSDDGGLTWHLYKSAEDSIAFLDIPHDPAGIAPPGINTTGATVAGSGTTGVGGLAEIPVLAPTWLCAIDTISEKSLAAVFTPSGGRFGPATAEGTINSCISTVVATLPPAEGYACYSCCGWPLPGALPYSDDQGSCALSPDEVPAGSGHFDCPFRGSYELDRPAGPYVIAERADIEFNPVNGYVKKKVWFRDTSTGIPFSWDYVTEPSSVEDDLCGGDGSGTATGSFKSSDHPFVDDSVALGNWIVSLP